MLSSQTSLTLLNRLRSNPGDEQLWQSFVALYGPRIHNWCIGWGLQSEDANDVTQNVLLAIVKQMETFQYDPKGRFRSWLKTIAYRAWADFLRKSGRNPARPQSYEQQALLESVEAQEDFALRMDQEAERLLLDEAILNIRQRVKKETWQAFETTVLEGVPGPETAKRLNLPISTIYKAKQRVQEMLKTEIQRIDNHFFEIIPNTPSNNRDANK